MRLGRRSRLRLDAIWAVPATLVLAVGCSATRFEHNPCTSDSQCRASFGFGAVCQQDGFCSAARLPRCDRSYPDDLLTAPARYADAIVLASLTDRASPAQLTREKAIRLAFKEVNAAGGLPGRPLAVLQCDIQQNPQLDGATRTQAAVATAGTLSRALGVPAIVGPATSADVQEVWDVVRGSGTLVLSPSATSPTLTRLEPELSDDHPGLLWTTAPTDLLQGQAIADDLLARNVSRVYVMRETGPYGEGLASLVSERFRAGGGSLQIESLTSDARIEAVVAAAPDDDAELVFISSQQSWVVAFLQAVANQPRLHGRSIFLTDAAANQAVFSAAAGAAVLFPQVRGTRPAPLAADEYVYASFVAGYRAEYAGENPNDATYSAHAYDAAWLALYGAAWAALQEGTVTGAGIGRGLRRISGGAATPMLPSSWKAVLVAFAAGRAIDVRGASGELNYDPATKQLSAPIEIWGVASEDGRFVTTPLDKGPQVSADRP
jgi:branched-chain amino acid transport system substrate-binding protein